MNGQKSLPQLFINRDLSWLEFNKRVLNEATNSNHPLFERIKFMGIFQSNLDEYFMKRMGSLYSEPRLAFRQKLLPLLKELDKNFLKKILSELAHEKIELVSWNELNDAERKRAEAYFHAQIFPVLTPLSVDQGHPFPFVSNLSTSLGVFLKNQSEGEQSNHFARIKVPKHCPEWIRVDSKKDLKTGKFISILDLISANLHFLFPGMEILDVMPFRVTRNTNIEHDEDESEDLLELLTEELKERKFGDVVRLEHSGKKNNFILSMLRDEFHLDEDQIYEREGLLEYTSLKSVTELSRADLKFSKWIPVVPEEFIDPDRDIFQIIKKQDVLVHHPYQSFKASVERFIKSAVDDPKVVAIKMTLYRVGAESPLIPLLIQAAEQGKHVVCLVELKARFDEEKNIIVAQKLEEAGIHVVYGVIGLKTHSKLALIVRLEGRATRSYCHIGTGNYHSITSQFYTDLGLFTSNPDITDDVVNLFHFLTGKSLKKDYKKLLVAPVNMKDSFLAKINREKENALKGKPAHIIIKINSFEDKDIAVALSQASKAGVKVDMIVRGFCCLRPKVKGHSENIRVFSILGRFLEHSRIFYFQNGHKKDADAELLMGSADLMYRNLNARVEAITPIESPAHKLKIIEILNIMLEDTVQSYEMNEDGSYTKRKSKGNKKLLGTHQTLMNLYHKKS